MAKAKVMSRSRNQIATSYAPESFFTFEGGLGACIARSAAGQSIDLAAPTKDQIFDRIEEIGRAWFDRALAARANEASKPQVFPVQCVDPRLLDSERRGFAPLGEDRIFPCRPSQMEYTPAPLTFVCRTCGLFRDYETLAKLDDDLANLSEERCQNPKGKGKCDWEQLDVIFVHWSGRWEPAFPGQYHWSDSEGKVVKRRDRCVCGSRDFRLDRRKPGVGDFFFVCAACSKPLSPKWLQNDPDTLRAIGRAMRPERYTEVRMQATAYRASSAYYVQADLFIDFKNGGQELLSRLRPGREEYLKDFIAKRYGFGETAITDDEVTAACQGRDDCKKEYADYLAANASIEMFNKLPAEHQEMARPLVQQAYSNRQRIIDDLRRRSILIPKVELPSSVESRLRERKDLFASKFDPFRLAIEHATLQETRLAIERRDGGKKPYVQFTNLDEDLAPEQEAEKTTLQDQTKDLLKRLGIADMGLIREFELCKFSFGYSRMDSGPVLRDKRDMNMPVRLNLFPPVRHNETQKNPVYVVQQANEALYVRLDEKVVLAWLKKLGCADMFDLQGAERCGAGLLKTAFRMSPFLDSLPQSADPPIYLYLYSLLHSYSHLLMKQVSEYSGLDLGSLGEYLFPADLAFVVYRNGTTMDLGNMSAMWRNAGTAMLASMLAAKATQCGTGSLCTERGGACPDCLMVPETSCIAGNKLLSRSVLRSIGGRPRFDERDGEIEGYLNLVGK